MGHFIGKIFIRITLGLLVGLIFVDWLAGRCRRLSHISDAEDKVEAERLKRHVETLSAIGSRFRVVEKSSGIKAAGN